MKEYSKIRANCGSDFDVSRALQCHCVRGATVDFTDPDPAQMSQMLPRGPWALTWTLVGPESTKISSQSSLPWNKAFIISSDPQWWSSWDVLLYNFNFLRELKRPVKMAKTKKLGCVKRINHVAVDFTNSDCPILSDSNSAKGFVSLLKQCSSASGCVGLFLLLEKP